MAARTGDAREDEVVLAVPARGEFGKLTRMTAARLGRTRGLIYREIEDLRLAVDEALVAVLDPDGEVGGPRLEARFLLSPGTIEIALRGGRPVDEGAADRFDRMVAALVDEASIDADGSARIVKRHAGQASRR